MQSQRTVLVQDQRLKMSTQLMQSIKLMELQVQDLRARIQEEVERNPALEIALDGMETSFQDDWTPSSSGDGSDAPVKNIQQEIKDLSKNTADKAPSDDYDYFENSSDSGYRTSNSSDAESKRKFLEGAVHKEESLQEHLLNQLRLVRLNKKEKELAELIIQNLDSSGFHLVPLPKLLESGGFSFENDELLIDQVLAMIHALEPQGCACEDYRESLLVQAWLCSETPSRIEEFIYNVFPDLAQKEKKEKILKKHKFSEEEYDLILEFLKSLNPYPGGVYSQQSMHYVTPDLMMKQIDGEMVLILNEEHVPVLQVNDYFEDLEREGSEKEIKRFVKPRLKDARWFISSLNKRNQTLMRAARAIVEHQSEFFVRGPKALRPLTLKDIAEVMEVHESTVNRITTNKYIQTEWGIYELKYFFTNSISGSGSGGSSFSKEGVKQILKELIEANDTGKRLSDQKLSDLLKMKGINIARRTVAKYRKELDIDSSFKR